jgi:hypothetical protein
VAWLIELFVAQVKGQHIFENLQQVVFALEEVWVEAKVMLFESQNIPVLIQVMPVVVQVIPVVI